MDNSTGFSTLTALTLQRDCFSSEQDRLAEYAKSLRVPVQVGEIIKGDKGDIGPRGEPGGAGPRGADGVDGHTPAMTSEDIEIGNGVSSVTVPGDLRNKIVNLWYEDLVSDPPAVIRGILCMRYDNTDTHVYLTGSTPNLLYRLRITGYV